MAIAIRCGWPNPTVYLHISVPENLRRMEVEIEAIEEQHKQKKFKS